MSGIIWSRPLLRVLNLLGLLWGGKIGSWIEAGVSLCHALYKGRAPKGIAHRGETQQFALPGRGFDQEAGHRCYARTTFVGEGSAAIPGPVLAGESRPHDWTVARGSGKRRGRVAGKDAIETYRTARHDHRNGLFVRMAIGHHLDWRHAFFDFIEAVEARQVHKIVGFDKRPQGIIAVVDMEADAVLLAGVLHAQMAFAEADFPGAEDAFGNLDQVRVDGDVVQARVDPGEEYLLWCVILAIFSQVLVVGWGEETVKAIESGAPFPFGEEVFNNDDALLSIAGDLLIRNAHRILPLVCLLEGRICYMDKKIAAPRQAAAVRCPAAGRAVIWREARQVAKTLHCVQFLS